MLTSYSGCYDCAYNDCVCPCGALVLLRWYICAYGACASTYNAVFVLRGAVFVLRGAVFVLRGACASTYNAVFVLGWFWRSFCASSGPSVHF